MLHRAEDVLTQPANAPAVRRQLFSAASGAGLNRSKVLVVLAVGDDEVVVVGRHIRGGGRERLLDLDEVRLVGVRPCAAELVSVLALPDRARQGAVGGGPDVGARLGVALEGVVQRTQCV